MRLGRTRGLGCLGCLGIGGLFGALLPVILIVALVVWLMNRQKTTMAPPASAPPGTRYCSKCGQPMDPGGSFCRGCGAQGG